MDNINGQRMLGYFSSYAGADIVAAINLPDTKSSTYMPYVLGTLSDISIATHRPKYEVLSLGYNRPRGFTSGPRVVAGQLIFVMFNNHLMHEIADRYQTNYASQQYEDSDIRGVYSVMQDKHEDELPLFDIVINFTNDDGYTSHMVIYGIQLLDSQLGFGINAPMTNVVYTYVAIDYKPITSGLFSNGKATIGDISKFGTDKQYIKDQPTNYLSETNPVITNNYL